MEALILLLLCNTLVFLQLTCHLEKVKQLRFSNSCWCNVDLWLWASLVGYPVYHSIYDDYLWMEKFGDPMFHRHVAGISFPSSSSSSFFSLQGFYSLLIA